MDVLKTGRIVSVAEDGSAERSETPLGSELFAPAFDTGSGRMVAHGPGPIEGVPGAMADGWLFAPPGGPGSSVTPRSRRHDLGRTRLLPGPHPGW